MKEEYSAAGRFSSARIGLGEMEAERARNKEDPRELGKKKRLRQISPELYSRHGGRASRYCGGGLSADWHPMASAALEIDYLVRLTSR